jgi:hypothetical protein
VLLQFYSAVSFVTFHRLYLSSDVYVQSIILLKCPRDKTRLFHQAQQRSSTHYLDFKMKAELAFETFFFNGPKII